MQAIIITIGDELLMGDVVDTNTRFMSEELNKAGVGVQMAISVPDERKDITDAIQFAFQRADLILMTGGLGPTKDDITKKAICDLYKTHLVVNEKVLDNITSIVKRKKAVLNKQNRMQAEVPATAKVIANPNGTAPGLWMEEQHKVLIAMPGVPVEMYSMVRDAVIPMIKKHFDLPFIIHKKVLVQGAFEAQLAELLEQFEDQLPDDIKLAYLPSPKQITLRLSATGINKFALEKHVDKQIQILKATIPQNIFGYDDDTLESIIGQMLTSHHKTISTAESCTGGSIAALITSVPGCSAYFKGSVVAYANEIKKQMLGVQEQTLIDHGAVSKQVVEEMVAGIKKLYNTDYAIAVSGIAGPTGGTQEKPVGTTWIAVAGQRNIISNHYLLGNNRDKNIQKTTNRALNDLRKLLISDLCK